MISKKVKFKEMYLEDSRNGIYKTKEFHGSGIKIVNMGELFKFDYIKNQEMELIELTDDEKNKFCLESGDLLFARRSVVADGAGKCSYVDNCEELTFESSIIRVRLNKDVCNSKYYYYYFKSPYGKGKILSISSGVSVKGIKGSDLKELEIDYVPITSQNKIVDILSKYDDLIENNLKRIKLLEETAELIYKEWFVNFRFPGYEKCEFADGMPREWEIFKVKDFGDVITGKTPSTQKAEYYGDEIPFIKTPDMSNGIYVLKTKQSLSEAGAKSQENKFIPRNTILVSCIGTLGVVALAKELSQFNQQINAVVCNKKEYIHYLYFKFKSLKEYLEALGSNGSTMGNVNKNKFENIEILKPNDKLLEKYNNFSEPIFKEILNLQLSNEKLKEARDILIPRLIMGEIEV
ncbi:restriction endonuclease subunit S [Clostridium sp.]|uniref:restriction endonuclease subunit S n=1 Tax=Clostridium sp. TaxID=1506 RepID=UPI00290C92F1|nr:restriction endonuclease subunit S [Clostridium sp.]MDU4847535.1 restriction endonuclease subunit S [Clostridium sp.]